MIKEPRYFTIKQFNRIIFDAAHAIVKYHKKMKLLNPVFKKQIMLTVSNVNNCNACSYVHSKALIKSGATNEELKPLIEGEFESLDDDVALALVFAQHYADQVGQYDPETFENIINYYGLEKAYGIMATIKVIMFGNTNGIALTNLFSRFKFKRNKKSKLGTELYNGLFAYLLLPVLIIINIFIKKKKY